LQESDRIIALLGQEAVSHILSDHEHLIDPVAFQIRANHLLDDRVGHGEPPFREEPRRH